MGNLIKRTKSATLDGVFKKAANYLAFFLEADALAAGFLAAALGAGLAVFFAGIVLTSHPFMVVVGHGSFVIHKFSIDQKFLHVPPPGVVASFLCGRFSRPQRI